MTATILVVDDEPHLEVIMTQAFRREIRGMEYIFLFARNGRQAIEILEQHQDVDLVISDINMPEMGGLLLLQKLTEGFPLIKTIIVTAYGDMTNIRAAMNHGAFDFLNKPIHFSDLRITIRKTLDHVNQLKDLYRERQQRFMAQKLQALTEHITTTLDLDEVLRRFLHNLAELVNFARGMVCLKEDQGFSLAATLGCDESFTNSEISDPISNVFERVSQRESSLSGEDLGSDMEAQLASVLGSHPAGLLYIPLFTKHGIPGLVILDRGENKPFESQEREVAFALSSNAAFAIENARLFEEVKRLATTDSLTGLSNRRHFMEVAEKEVLRSLRYSNPLCAVMVDVDNFKSFNDNHGHATGDMVLQTLATILKRECRQTDLLGRLGGDELVILLIETDIEAGREIAERLRKAVAQEPFRVDQDTVINVTISMGMSSVGPGVADLHELLRDSDRNLYDAKNRGRNRLVVG